uniref:Uncharacterized protein n=1 Tax=Strongyloides stercoralis TaxID=6248 RepID=A0AAF5DLC6_STRER
DSTVHSALNNAPAISFLRKGYTVNEPFLYKKWGCQFRSSSRNVIADFYSCKTDLDMTEGSNIDVIDFMSKNDVDETHQKEYQMFKNRLRVIKGMKKTVENNVSKKVWKRVYCDILKQFKIALSGNKYIPTMVCSLNEFVVLNALQRTTAENIENILVEKIHYTTSNTHNSNGQVERITRIFNEKLIINNKDLYLSKLQSIINLNINKVIEFSPFFPILVKSDDKIGNLSVIINLKLCKDDILSIETKKNINNKTVNISDEV